MVRYGFENENQKLYKGCYINNYIYFYKYKEVKKMMIKKKIVKFGTSCFILLPKAFMDYTGLKLGDEILIDTKHIKKYKVEDVVWNKVKKKRSKK